MTLTVEDRLAITELVNLHGHIVDSGEFDRLGELFTADLEYDVTDLGGGVLGLDDFRAASLAMGERNPLAHHVTNVVVTETDGEVVARSKGLGVMVDGTMGSVTYRDVVVRTPAGWRIRHRTVRARRTPLVP